MKKIRRIAAILLVSMLCLTGCMRYNVTITVKRNGKIDISMLMAMMTTEGMGDIGQGLTEEDKQQFVEKGWDVEEYNKDNYYGFLMSKKDITPEEVSESVDSSQNTVQGSSSGFSFTKEGLKYVIDWKMNSSKPSEEGSSESADLSQYANYFKLYNGFVTLTVNLPIKPVNSNATTVSNNGKTLEWDLLAMDKDSSIHLEFMLINIWLIVLIVVAALIGIALIVIAIVLIVKRSKRSKVPVVHMQPLDDANSMSWGGMDTDFQVPAEKADTDTEPKSVYFGKDTAGTTTDPEE
ncbi:MAG: hypothetical protein J6U10_09400 [Lachnospiraceae bacterium]|nr:hypothetical protein [Lachnospiraceae bacterium]